MIGLDTNVVLRHLLQDDPTQSPRATAILERELTAAEPGFISVVVMVEAAWVLDRVYGFSNLDIAAAIERLLQTGAMVVEDAAEVFTAMVALREDRGSFADALIGALGAKAGCAHTVTFDKRAGRLDDFEMIAR